MVAIMLLHRYHTDGQHVRCGVRAAVLGGNYDQARTLANESWRRSSASSRGPARYPEDSTVNCNPAPPVRPRHPAKVSLRSHVRDRHRVSAEPTVMVQVTVRVEWSGGNYERRSLIARRLVQEKSPARSA